MLTCPCCSEKSFTDCCESIIKSESATTALALMRSRYTAYCAHSIEYLHITTHPKKRVKNDLSEIENWANENNWTKLEIINVEKGNEKDSIGIIEFKAYFTDKYGVQQIHHEKSNFLKEGEKWFYLDGIINPKKSILNKTVLRNEPCICGSGRKFKNCCR